MTNDELKEALLNCYPVLYGGIEYSVYGIQYTCPSGRIKVSAVLLDGNSNTLVTANPKQITLKEV